MFKLISSLNANRSHFETISVDELINKIKTPSEGVLNARLAGKKTNRTDYDRIKTTSIEAYHPNEYEGVSTGYIYLDIDDFKTTQEAIEYKSYLINKYSNLITLCWLSVSNLGLSILIKVDNVTQSNYNQYWDFLNQLFEYKIDKNSRGYSKVNCISFDKDIYINHNSISIEQYIEGGCSSHLLPLNLISNHCTPPSDEDCVNKQLLHPPVSIKYKTELPESNFENINTPVIIKEGMKVLQIDLRYFAKNKINVGERNKVLGAISMQLIALNPLPEGYPERQLRNQLLSAVLYINKHYTLDPLTIDEVIKIFNANYKRYKEQGYLDVKKYYHKTKYVFWHRDCQIPARERVSIGLTLLNKERGKGKEYNQGIIYEAIEALQDGIQPITRQRIMDVTGIKIDTLKRYWKPFKSIIDEYNNSITLKKLEEKPQIEEIVKDNGIDICSMPITVSDEVWNFYDNYESKVKGHLESLEL